MNDPQSTRDWLLARHASATPQLDALRRAALPRAAEEINWREFLARVFRPHRLAWRTLAAVWLVLAALHLAQQRAGSTAARSTTSSEAFATWLRQAKTHEALAQISRHP
jgi:hypothetical protein